MLFCDVLWINTMVICDVFSSSLAIKMHIFQGALKNQFSLQATHYQGSEVDRVELELILFTYVLLRKQNTFGDPAGILLAELINRFVHLAA